MTVTSSTDTTSDGYAIAMVCLGNICRSPIAAVVLAAKLAREGLDTVTVDSAGTGSWHIGDPMDRRAASLLADHGYDAVQHRARQFTPDWFDTHDLVLAMDRTSIDELARLSRSPSDLDQVQLFRAFDPEAETSFDVPDPWYGGRADFELVLAICERTTDVLVDELRDLDGIA